MKKLLKIAAKTSQNYKLVEPNDNILVSFSGGKDSFVLVEVFKYFKKILPFQFDFQIVHINQGYSHDIKSKMEVQFASENLRFDVLDRNHIEIINRFGKQNKSKCPFCARLRRGVLYKYAYENNFTKIALGHHFNDLIETFFLNLFYNGQIKTFLPKYLSDDKKNVVIRPMILVKENAIESAVKEVKYEVYNIECRYLDKKKSKRFEMKQKLETFAEENKYFYRNLNSAMRKYIDERMLKQNLYLSR